MVYQSRFLLYQKFTHFASNFSTLEIYGLESHSWLANSYDLNNVLLNCNTGVITAHERPFAFVSALTSVTFEIT